MQCCAIWIQQLTTVTSVKLKRYVKTRFDTSKFEVEIPLSTGENKKGLH